MTGSFECREDYDEGELCIDESPLSSLASMECLQDMPLDLSISKTSQSKPEPSGHHVIRVRTDLIGPVSTNEVLDLSKRSHNNNSDFANRKKELYPRKIGTNPLHRGLVSGNSIQSHGTGYQSGASSPLMSPRQPPPPSFGIRSLLSMGGGGSNSGHRPPPLNFNVITKQQAKFKSDKPAFVQRNDSVLKGDGTKVEQSKQYFNKLDKFKINLKRKQSEESRDTDTASKVRHVGNDVIKKCEDDVSHDNDAPVISGENDLHEVAKDVKKSASPSSSGSAGIWNMTVSDMEKMFEPYISQSEKKYNCTVCTIKFPHKDKLISHIENKHIDCFQYKCPLCRTTKTSRLAFDCHIRSRHSADKKSLDPLLRLKRQFAIKNDRHKMSGDKGNKGGKEIKKKESYDLHFVTFLREELNGCHQQQESNISPAPPQQHQILSLQTNYLNNPHTKNNNSLMMINTTSANSKPASPNSPAIPRSQSCTLLPPSPSVSPALSGSSSVSREGSLSPGSPSPVGSTSTTGSLATWLNKDQGMFMIKEKQKFASKWFLTKGHSEGDWDKLQQQVLSIFQSRNLIKVITERPAVFQVFCIRQLLQ
jgi:hypothetical protein